LVYNCALFDARTVEVNRFKLHLIVRRPRGIRSDRLHSRNPFCTSGASQNGWLYTKRLSI